MTLGLFLDSKLKGSKSMAIDKAAGYVAAQLAAGASAFFVAGLIGGTGAPADATTTGAVGGFLPAAVVVEAIGTFFLVFVVLQV